MALIGARFTAASPAGAPGFVTDARPKNWREGIMLLNPNGSAPLFALTSLMKSKVTDDPEFNWWEKSLQSQRLELPAGAVGVTTAITITTATYQATGIKVGHVLRAEETNELMRVTAVADTELTVTRAFGNTITATDFTVGGNGVNPYLQVVGTAYEENSAAPAGINYDPSKKYSFTQIFRNTLEMSRTAQKTRLRTGDAVREAKRECLELHSMEIEKAFWFGERDEALSTSAPIRATDGFFSWLHRELPANERIVDGSDLGQSAGNLDMSDLEAVLKQAFDYGASEKMGFCGNTALLAINQAVRHATSFNLEQGATMAGMRVNRLVCPFGTVILKTHPLWNQLPGGTVGSADYYGMDSTLAIIDDEEFVYRYLTDSDTDYQPKLQDNGLDGMQSGYITECGLEMHHAQKHLVCRQIQNGIAEA